MGTENFHFKVGRFECVALNDGVEPTPTATLAKNVPPAQVAQALVEQGFPPEEYVCAFNCLLIRTGEHQLLVDTGWGDGTERLRGNLSTHLEAEGILPADIDRIALTHMDGDHVAGILDTAGELVFPNARYFIGRGAWNFWSDETRFGQMPAWATTFGRVTLPRIRDQVEVVEAEAECLEGIRLIPAPGHRPGHGTLEICSDGVKLWHLADVLAHPIFLTHPDWCWAFDSFPERAQSDRKKFIERAASEQALVFAAHLPFPGVGRLLSEGQYYRWQPVSK